MRGWAVVLGVFSSLSIPSVASAADWFVDAAAGGGGDGSEGAPFSVLQDGLDAAMPGDVVLVAPGTYAPIASVRDGAEGTPIVVRSTEPREAVVQSTAEGLEIGHAFHRFVGLVFDCGYSDADCIEGGGADGLELSDVEVRNAGADCIDLRTSNDVLIEDSDIHHCVAPYDPGNNADAHGVTGDSVLGLTIRRCTIRIVSGDAIQLSPSRDPWDDLLVEDSVLEAGPIESGVQGWPADEVIGENAFDSKVGDELGGDGERPRVIFRDVVARGWRGPIGNAAAFNVKEEVDFTIERTRVSDSELAFRLRGPATVTVINTVVFDVDIAARLEDGLASPRFLAMTIGRGVGEVFTDAGDDPVGVDVRNMLVLGGELPALAGGASNLAVDASAFIDADADDYHLVEGGPPVDVGEDLPEVADDLDGVARPVGDGYDIGAYEWTDAPPPGETDGGSTGGGDEGGGATSGEDSTSGGSASASGSDGGDGSDSGAAVSSGSASGSGGAGEDDGADGCGCRTGRGAPGGALMLLLLVALRRRGL